jgi:outer membrane protein assembly factor BamD
MVKNFALIVLTSLFFLIGCSTPRPEGQTEAEILFREAEELVSRKRYMLASEKLNQIRSQHPYSFYATHAELMQANILFDQGNYTESAAAYILFRDFHPRHEQTPFVVWRIAESFYNQLPKTYDRDLSAGAEALKYYREILRLFENSEYASQAVTKIETIEQMQSNRERYIADFYFRTKVYSSARERYLFIVETYREPRLRNHAILRVLESSYRMKERESCLNYSTIYKGLIDSRYESQFRDLSRRCSRLKQES